MQRSFAYLLVAALVAFTGCNNSSPGGPGATNPDTKKPVVGRADNTFTLDAPNLATKLKQGESKAVSIAIKRGKNFSQDITLKFDNVPNGMSIDPASPVIKHGDEEAKVTFKTTNDAALGDFTIKVTGRPSSGADASTEFKITVDKK
jgi:uncharacterized membrane protein